MKSIPSLLLFVLTLMLAACGSSKNASSDASTSSAETVSTTNPNQTDRRAQVQQEFQEMVAKLNLSEDQVDPFIEIIRDGQQKMQNIRQNNQGDFQGMRTEMQAMRTEQESKLSELLSEEQMTLYKQLSREMMQRRRSGRGN